MQSVTCAYPKICCPYADDVGHLEGGPAHRFISLLERFTLSELRTAIASSGLGTACRWRAGTSAGVQVDGGVSELGMAEKHLDGARSAPASSMCVAKQCLKLWGDTCLVMPARLAASFT